MKYKTKSKFKYLIYGFAILALISIIFASISFVSGYKDELKAQTESKVLYLVEKASISLDLQVNSIIDEARTISEYLSRCDGTTNICQYLERIVDHTDEDNTFNENLVIGRYIHDGKVFTSSSSQYLGDISEILKIEEELTNIKFIGVYYDTSLQMNLAVVVIPYSSDYYDGVILYYLPSVFEKVVVDADDSATFLGLSRKNGQITSVFKDTELIDTNNFATSLSNLVGESSQVSNILKFDKPTNSTFVSTNSSEYVLVSNQIDDYSNLYVVGLYDVNDVFASEYTFYNTISGLLIFFVALVIIFFIVFVIKYIYNNFYNKGENRNTTYACLSQSGFIYEAGEILNSNPGSKFAVVVAQIRFFKYIQSVGDGFDKKIALSLRSILRKALGDMEVFGYDSNGKFYLLLRYTSNETLVDRLKQINMVSRKIKIDSDKRLSLYYGICPSEKDVDVLTIVEHANESLRVAEQNIGVTFYNIYDKEEFADCLDREFIEMNVESALKKGDFKVFYQPKYNIKRNGVDGAEALVRWYIPDENRFYPPASFLPVIEANGFIGLVDRYVFEQVCIYLRHSLDSGERVYPISVNISRVTLSQEDFVDYYTNVKNKYKIRDGLLVLELTESSAFEEYAILADVINKLHQSGFICSIDDFGTGFSSYNCLKVLKMDEIKLDRFFLKPGNSPESDRLIIKSVIDVGRALGMKVTVEGVSSVDELNMLKELECDVIQGYLYSKPMPQADFISFLQSSMRGKFE